MVNIIDDTEQVNVQVLPPGPIENFFSYEKVDPTSRFAISPSEGTAINVTDLTRDISPYLRKQGSFGDFDLKFAVNISNLEFNPTANNQGSWMQIAMFVRNATSINANMTYPSHNKDGILLSFSTYTSGSSRFYVVMQLRNNEFSGPGSSTPDYDKELLTEYISGSPIPRTNINYYVHLWRTGGVVYVDFFTAEDMNPNSRIWSANVLAPTTDPYLYFLPVSSYGTGGTYKTSATVWDYTFSVV